jgi:hypothetical protein
MRRTLCVFNRTRESFLGLRVAPADTWRMGLKALSENSGVTPDDGIWLIPSRGVDTIGMLCALDLIYLDSANRVLLSRRTTGAGRYLADQEQMCQYAGIAFAGHLLLLYADWR